MSVPAMTLTDDGNRLLTRALAGEVLTFTRMAMGDGVLSAVGAVPGLKGLIHQVVNVPITKKKRRETDVTLSGVVALTSDTPEFRWRELGVFAKIGSESEKLYGYLNLYEDGEIVKPDEGMERSIYITVATEGAQNVEVVLTTLSTPEIGDLTPVANDLEFPMPGDKFLVSDINDSGIVKLVTMETLAGAHGHQWESIGSKPATFPPSAHSHTPSSIGAASSSHYHYWSSIREKPTSFPPSEHSHPASEIVPAAKLFETTVTLVKGTKSVDITNADALVPGLVAQQQILVVHLTGTIQNTTSSTDYYSLGGVVNNGINTVAGADNSISGGTTHTIDRIYWFFRSAPQKWRKDYELGQSTLSAFRETATPLVFDTNSSRCNATLTAKVYGVRLWPMSTSGSGSGQGDGETPEIPIE